MRKLNYVLAAVMIWLPALAMAGGKCAHGAGGCGGAGKAMAVVYLLTLALGYWVLKTASSDKGFSKRVGQIAAWIILLVSLGGLICGAVKCVKQCRESKSMCPLSSSSQPETDDEDEVDEMLKK